MEGALCPVCQKIGVKVCKPCQSVSYCSVEHQKSAWTRHIPFCCPYIVTTCDDPILGQGWTAARNLKAGSIILNEPPTFHAPRWTEQRFWTGKNGSKENIPNCIVCGLFMDLEMDRRCSVCHWPVCSMDCEQTPIHAENECRIFKQKSVNFPPSNSISPSDLCTMIGVLRGVALKLKTPAAHQQLMELQHGSTMKEFNSILTETAREVVEKLHTFVGGLEQPKEDYERIWRLAKMNEFTGPFEIPRGQGNAPIRPRINSRVYPKASRLNHSCSPNCAWRLGPFPACKIEIRTLVNVKKGESLTHCYDTEQNFMGTYERQKGLRRTSGFICKCSRCLDNTELNTFTSAMTCLSCYEKRKSEGKESGFGWLLPDNPLDLNSSSILRCNRCGAVKNMTDLTNIVLPLTDKLRRLEEEDGTKGRENLEKIYENVLDQYGVKILHENHWLLQKSTRALLRQYRLREEDVEVTEEILEKCIKLQKYVLNNLRLVSPGLSAEAAKAWHNLSFDLRLLLDRFSRNMPGSQIVQSAQLCFTAQNNVLKYSKLEAHLDDPMFCHDDLVTQLTCFLLEWKSSLQIGTF